MTPEVKKYVEMATQPKEMNDLCERLKNLVKMSRDEMQKNYTQWDYYDQVYRGERAADLQDIQARKRGEPEKMILPLTFGQVQTFVAFGHTTYNQRDYFYEMIASGEEDEKPAQIASALLEQNLIENKFRATKLTQFLTDIARFGVGITKEAWVNDLCPVLEEVPDEAAMAQVRAGLLPPANVPMVKRTTLKSKYQGNRIINISPYRWFPDTRLPLTRWSEGEFCADELEESLIKLRKLERDGLVGGLEHVPELPTEAYDNRRLTFMKKSGAAGTPYAVKPNYLLNLEVQVRLNPAHTEIAPGVMLNKDFDYDTVYIVWIANDNRIIRISEAGYDHEEFGYNAAQLFDDQNRFINFSLCEVLSACQDTATWFLNSHITSVRKNIFPQFIVDPSGIEIDDIIKRSPLIRTKPGRAGSGVNQWIQQLAVTDVTTNHINDVATLSSMAKEATGINETLLGQFSSGRRSAKEAANVANYAASRLMILFASIWESGLAPMGKKMLSNLRQGLDEETVIKVYGSINTQRAATEPDIPGLPPPLYRLIGATKADLYGNYDFASFNGTLPTQRSQTAMVLKEVGDAMMKNPATIPVFGLDPQLIFFEVLNLLNIRNVQRFRLTPERLQQLTLMGGQPANPSSAPGAGGGSGRPQGNPR